MGPSDPEADDIPMCHHASLPTRSVLLVFGKYHIHLLNQVNVESSKVELNQMKCFHLLFCKISTPQRFLSQTKPNFRCLFWD